MIQFVTSWMLILSLQKQESLLQFIINYNKVYQLQKSHHSLDLTDSAVTEQSLKLNTSDFLVRELIFTFFMSRKIHSWSLFSSSFTRLQIHTLTTKSAILRQSLIDIIIDWHWSTVCLQINSCWMLCWHLSLIFISWLAKLCTTLIWIQSKNWDESSTWSLFRSCIITVFSALTSSRFSNHMKPNFRPSTHTSFMWVKSGARWWTSLAQKFYFFFQIEAMLCESACSFSCAFSSHASFLHSSCDLNALLHANSLIVWPIQKPCQKNIWTSFLSCWRSTCLQSESIHNWSNSMFWSQYRRARSFMSWSAHRSCFIFFLSHCQSHLKSRCISYNRCHLQTVSLTVVLLSHTSLLQQRSYSNTLDIEKYSASRKNQARLLFHNQNVKTFFFTLSIFFTSFTSHFKDQFPHCSDCKPILHHFIIAF